MAPSGFVRRASGSFSFQVLIGMALGLVLGFLARDSGPDSWLATLLNTIGQIFVQLLKALVVPLVFTAIVSSIAALRELNGAGRLVSRTLLWSGISASCSAL